MKPSDQSLLSVLHKRLTERKSLKEENYLLRAELRKLGARLYRSEQMKTNFLSNVRNEINNPVASVLGLSKLMLEAEHQEPSQLRKTAALIHHEMRSLEFQMRNIIVAADIEAGAIQVNPAATPVAKLIDEAVITLQHKCEAKHVHFDISLAGDESPFSTDGELLFLILINLLDNALEYGPKGSKVLITHNQTTDSLRISVADSGPGIRKEDQERIFDRFRQLDEGCRKQHAGHGLGLSIVRELTESLSGSVSVENISGGGTRFQITIPPLTPSTNINMMEEWNEILFSSDQVL